jgi:hypothetical protein
MASGTTVGACAAALGLLLLAGCGTVPGPAHRAPTPRPPGPQATTVRPKVRVLPLPSPTTFVERLSDRQASSGVSLVWHSTGADPVAGRAFDAAVDVAPCTRFQGVHFRSRGGDAEVAMVGRKSPGPCTLERRTALVRVAWPSGMPAHGAVTHAPTD